jgi:glycosyltransferase involved in cell wall biosynthesis
MPSCSILIPAFNEAASIANVIGPALSTNLGPVLVVDDGSSDATQQVARKAGAQVLRLEANTGKGGAVYAGALHLQSDVIVLLDADLLGLTPNHIVALARPVLENRVDMTRGVFAGGRWSTSAAQKLTPQLNGQRALLRERLLTIHHLAESRYGIEIAITKQAKREHWRTLDVPMHGVSQVMKEEKLGFVRGFLTRLRMYLDILTTYVRNLFVR